MRRCLDIVGIDMPPEWNDPKKGGRELMYAEYYSFTDALQYFGVEDSAIAVVVFMLHNKYKNGMLLYAGMQMMEQELRERDMRERQLWKELQKLKGKK